MTYTSAHCCAIPDTFDPRIAAHELKRYRRKGPRSMTRRLLSAIREAGVERATLLDIGGGVGEIGHELLGAGAEHATLVDASPAYLDAAIQEAERRKHGARFTVVHADFVTRASTLPIADVVTLDKVVCCYPDMPGLIAASTGRARRLYGLVYPRERWWIELAVATQNGVRRLRRSAFRAYIHSTTAIDAAIRDRGFVRRHHDAGFIWVVDLYERQPSRL
jgi:SAM-dependent methyltransferase